MTNKSGGRSTQVDYILCRRCNPKEISDCKVLLVGESAPRQHKVVVCVTLVVRKMKRSKADQRTQCWKLKKEDCCMTFRKTLRQALDGQEFLPVDWTPTANVMWKTGRRGLVVSSGRKVDKETWG